MYVKVAKTNATKSEYFRIKNVPEYLTIDDVVKILQRNTHYDYSVRVLDHYPKKHHEHVKCDSLEAGVEHIKTIQLYKREMKRKSWWETEIMESIDFKLSTCFQIDDVSYSSYCTFFKIKSTAKDVLFNEEPLSKILSIKMATSGYYYMVGKWNFKHLEKINWTAIRTKETYREEIIGEEVVPF